MKKILIAGIGNIFQGDDAFGCEVVRELKRGSIPEQVTVTDFGIRRYDLAYALNNEFDAIILVDTVSRGGKPGTVYAIEPDVTNPEHLPPSAPDGHTTNPVSVIQMAQSLGGISGKLYLIGCEPAVLESDKIELSPKVRKAIPEAIEMIATLVKTILSQHGKMNAGLEAA